MTLSEQKSRLKIIHSFLNETPKLKWMESYFFVPDLKVEWNKTASNYVRLTVCLLACCFWEFFWGVCAFMTSVIIWNLLKSLLHILVSVSFSADPQPFINRRHRSTTPSVLPFFVYAQLNAVRFSFDKFFIPLSADLVFLYPKTFIIIINIFSDVRCCLCTIVE